MIIESVKHNISYLPISSNLKGGEQKRIMEEYFKRNMWL